MSWPLVGRAAALRDLGRILGGSLPGGVVICGDAGVGKTRLLAEFVDDSAASGWATEWVTGAVSTASVPMGAVAKFVPQELPPMSDTVQFLAATREALLARGGGQPLLLAVDDVPRLDAASASFVAHLTVTGYCFVACTARADEPLPSPIEALTKDQIMDRVELGPLADADIETLVHSHLDGQIDPAIIGRATQLVEGNPLFLRELLADGIESGSLRVQDGRWVFEEPFGASTGLGRLVAGRMGALSDSQRAGLEALAVAEPLELEMADAFFAGESLVDLERRGVIRILTQGRRRTVAFVHPLFGETIRAETPVTRRRRIAGELLRATVAAGARRREDTLRLATWHLDSGESIDESTALAAARFANAASDHRFAELIARSVFEAKGRFHAGLELGEAVSRQGRTEEAEDLYLLLGDRADTDERRVALVMRRADNRFFRAADYNGATRLLEDVRAGISDPVSLMMLDSQLILMLAFKPDPSSAFALAVALTEVADAPDEAVLGATTVLGLLAVWRCDCPAVHRATELGLELVETVGDAVPDASARLRLNCLVCQMFDGRVEEAVHALREGYQQAITPPIDDFASIWASYLSVALAIRGQVQDAVEVGRNALLLGSVSHNGFDDGSAGFCAVVAGQAGDEANVELALDRLEAAPTINPPAGFWIPRAQAWQHALAGDIQTAVELATRAGQAAMDDDIVLCAALAMYDTVLFGQPPQCVVEQLERIAAGTPALTIRAYAEHASTLIAGDPEGVEDVAAGFRDRNELLYAVTAYLQAAKLYRDQGRGHAAVRAATKAIQLDTQLPAGVFAETLPGLTEREAEIATLAARGLTSRQIADRLYLSIRTVNNHLATTYTKLGIHNRDGLADVMRVP